MTECFVRVSKYGYITFPQIKNHQKSNGLYSIPVFINDYDEGDLPAKFQLSLENNMMIITAVFQNETTNLYHAGANTNGTWFRFISESSLIVKTTDTKDQVSPEMGYIGDIKGVFAIIDQKGNWILYNKTKVIWESGTTQEYANEFDLILKRSGNVAIRQRICDPSRGEDDYIWSTQNLFPAGSSKRLGKSELLVNNDGMWLIHTFIDGTVNKFKALEGTNNFTLLSNGDEVEVPSSSSPQIYEL